MRRRVVIVATTAVLAGSAGCIKWLTGGEIETETVPLGESITHGGIIFTVDRFRTSDVIGIPTTNGTRPRSSPADRTFLLAHFELIEHVETVERKFPKRDSQWLVYQGKRIDEVDLPLEEGHIVVDGEQLALLDRLLAGKQEEFPYEGSIAKGWVVFPVPSNVNPADIVVMMRHQRKDLGWRLG